MNKKKIVVYGCTFVLLLGLASIPMKADTVNPGDGFRVNVSCGDVEGSVQAVGNNATVTSAGNWCNRGAVVEVTATAGSAGTATVSIVGVDATGNASTSNPVSMNGQTIGSASVTVAQPSSPNNGGTETPSNNNEPATNNGNETKKEEPKKEEKKEEEKKKDANSQLSSLSISTGTLSPAFKASTTAYTVSLPAGTTSLKVEAKANKSTSVLDGTGEHKLKTGKNIIEVTCIAEDGSTTVYTITASVSEKPLAYLNYNGKKLGILPGTAKVSKLFTSTKIKVDGVEVDAWKNDALNITLLYMQDDASSEKNLYMYDVASNSITSIYKPFAVAGRNLVQIDVPKELQKRSGMTFTTVKVGKSELPGWKFDDQNFANYALIYVMDDKGNKVYYQYEAAEESLQIYSGAATITQQGYDDYVKSVAASLKKHKYVIYGLAGFSVILLIVIGFLVFFRKKKTTKFKKVDIQGKSHESRFHIEADALTNTDDEE